jgi:hypothetical protein
VEAGESEYSGLSKTRKLLKNRHAQKSKSAKIAPNWNVFGTRDFFTSLCCLPEQKEESHTRGTITHSFSKIVLSFKFAPIVSVQHRWNSTLNLDPVQRHHHVSTFQSLL